MAVAEFYPLKVQDIRKECEDAVSIAFDVPDTLAEKFAFIPGQYLSLKKDLNGEDIRRAYSICSTPDDGELRVAVKRMVEGVFSNYVNDQLKSGDVLEVLPPVGRFHVPLDPDQAKIYVGIAGGSGITPFHSIIRTVLQKQPMSQFTLFYGNRTKATSLFRDSLEGLKRRYEDRFQLFHIYSEQHSDDELLSGLLDQEKCASLFEAFVDMPKVDYFLMCGPTPMIKAARSALKVYDIAPERQKFELFGTQSPSR